MILPQDSHPIRMTWTADEKSSHLTQVNSRDPKSKKRFYSIDWFRFSHFYLIWKSNSSLKISSLRTWHISQAGIIFEKSMVYLRRDWVISSNGNRKIFCLLKFTDHIILMVDGLSVMIMIHLKWRKYTIIFLSLNIVSLGLSKFLTETFVMPNFLPEYIIISNWFVGDNSLGDLKLVTICGFWWINFVLVTSFAPHVKNNGCWWQNWPTPSPASYSYQHRCNWFDAYRIAKMIIVNTFSCQTLATEHSEQSLQSNSRYG